MSGKVDYVSDGRDVWAIDNGSHWQENITGSGCMASACVLLPSLAVSLFVREPIPDVARRAGPSLSLPDCATSPGACQQRSQGASTLSP